MRMFSIKHLGVWLVTSAIVFSCCQKPIEPIVEPPITIPRDLDPSQTRRRPFGGDPRGTYYPNTPLIVLSGDTKYYDFTPHTVNGGSGKLIIEGLSATTGTWRAENIAFQYDGIMRYNGSPYPISTVNHDSLAKFFRSGSGWWGMGNLRNNPSQITFWNRTTGFDFDFTVDSLGMYFYTSPPRISFPPDANTILCTTIFKKQR
jgi:hypothetical protein